MKKNIIKPKFYTLQEDSVNQPSTGYIFLKHYRPILSEKNKDKKYLSGITKLYYQTEVKKSNREYINIAERREKMDIDSFNQYLIINYNISYTKFFCIIDNFFFIHLLTHISCVCNDFCIIIFLKPFKYNGGI